MGRLLLELARGPTALRTSCLPFEWSCLLKHNSHGLQSPGRGTGNQSRGALRFLLLVGLLIHAHKNAKTDQEPDQECDQDWAPPVTEGSPFFASLA